MSEGCTTNGMTKEHLVVVAERFQPRGRVLDVREYGSGHINSTFLVTQGAKEEKHFILQRINTQVFRRPELVMRNMRTVTEHVLHRLRRTPLSGRRWEVVRVLPARDGQDHWLDADGSFWRAISFIDAAQSFDTIQDLKHAREVGTALGMFQNLVGDLPSDSLADTLEGFHITPRYLRHYDDILAKHAVRRSPEVNVGLRFVSERRAWAHVLEHAEARGLLQLRPIHGDPKVNNVLIDTATGQAVSMVDLDTVKPGLVLYDIGDCLRSSCNLLGEQTERWETVTFESDICQAILQGYLGLTGTILTENDYEYLFDAIRLIAFELGLRFLTDYLEGNVYFKVRHPEHNLIRALIQFRLTESIESQEKTIRSIIRDLR
jgi:hypothetical protein